MNTLLKKSSIFANLLMEKPDNSFAIVKMWKKTPEEKIFLEKDLHLYLKIQSGTVFSPCFLSTYMLNTTLFSSFFFNKRAHTPYAIQYNKTPKSFAIIFIKYVYTIDIPTMGSHGDKHVFRVYVIHNNCARLHNLFSFLMDYGENGFLHSKMWVKMTEN